MDDNYNLLSALNIVGVYIVASRFLAVQSRMCVWNFIEHLILFTVDRRVQVLNLFLCSCLSHIVCRLFYNATEVIPLTKSSVRLLDNCVKQAVAKICLTSFNSPPTNTPY